MQSKKQTQNPELKPKNAPGIIPICMKKKVMSRHISSFISLNVMFVFLRGSQSLRKPILGFPFEDMPLRLQALPVLWLLL